MTFDLEQTDALLSTTRAVLPHEGGESAFLRIHHVYPFQIQVSL